MERSPYAGESRATFAERLRRHDDMAEKKAEVLAERIDLGEEYLDAHPPHIVVPYEQAVTTIEAVVQTRAARDEALARAGDRQATLAADGPVLALATDPFVLAPVVHYFGMLPILLDVFTTRADRTEPGRQPTQRFQLDAEDTTACKVLVHLTDVDEQCGPFHALPADATQRVLAAVDHRGAEVVEDTIVADVVGWEQVMCVTGPAGTVAIADTARCLHYDGQPSDAGLPGRDTLVYHYVLPTSLRFSTDAPRLLPQLAPTGDQLWDALIGASLT